MSHIGDQWSSPRRQAAYAETGRRDEVRGNPLSSTVRILRAATIYIQSLKNPTELSPQLRLLAISDRIPEAGLLRCGTVPIEDRSFDRAGHR